MLTFSDNEKEAYQASFLLRQSFSGLFLVQSSALTLLLRIPAREVLFGLN